MPLFQGGKTCFGQVLRIHSRWRDDHDRGRHRLAPSGTTMSPLAPSRPGLLLWSASEQVVFGGAGGRFPTIGTDFAAEGDVATAPFHSWYLDHSDTDLQADVHHRAHAIRDPFKTQAFLKKYLQEAWRHATCKIIPVSDIYDVYRQLLGVAIRNTELDDRARYERGSLGDMLVSASADFLSWQRHHAAPTQIRSRPGRC